MQLLLELFFFSILLTTGSALWCELCTSQSSDCTGSNQECGFDNAVCMTLNTELGYIGTQKIQATLKTCSPKDFCKALELLKGKTTISQTPGIDAGALITDATCSKAPPSFASFFPAFLGLLLMKVLF